MINIIIIITIIMIIIIIFITLLVDLLHYRSIITISSRFITLLVDCYITGRVLHYWL